MVMEALETRTNIRKPSRATFRTMYNIGAKTKECLHALGRILHIRVPRVSRHVMVRV